MTTRIMRDSTNPGDIPHQGLDLVAGYVNGRFAWSENHFNRFGNIPHVHIDCFGIAPDVAGVLDVEAGDATVATAVKWVRNRTRIGFPNPVIYCNRSTLRALFNAMAANGYFPDDGFRLWVATLDGTKRLIDMTGVVAVQYAGSDLTGGHYDQSLVYDDAWHPAS